mmetsp:Transcript_11655/g.24505  ORF Transcript_11655/g.24505 Transcript_11655/m.24505 type:complete len:579 (+) Transcript_11655:49-1785(+)
MDQVYNLIQQRNAIETLPFVSLHSSNSQLRNLVASLQFRCESLERQYLELQQLLADQALLVNQSNQNIIKSGSGGVLKNEGKLREKIAKLQKDLNEKLRNEVKLAAEAAESSKEISQLNEEKSSHEATIATLNVEIHRCNEIITHLTNELEESKSRTRLAEAQFDGLKDAIRSLQEENEEKSKLNQRLLDETIAEKEKFAEQFNTMNDTIEKLQKENNMLRSLSKMEKSWFGLPKKGILAGAAGLVGGGDAKSKQEPEEESSERQWGVVGAVVPSQPLFTVKAHRDDAASVRYDGTNQNLVATASSDSTIRVWDTGNGQLQASFSGGGSYPMLGVDISGSVICGCGADKTCRVWRYDTKRMIHQLAGHSQKITCVRLFAGEKNIITGSADRSIRIWDISRHIYTHTTTFRHSSTTNCMDVSGEKNCPIVTGHLDGGVRCWDARTGDRALDIPALHEGGVTSVQWKPGSIHEVLTNGRDSTLKIVDARNNSVVLTFRDRDFCTLTNHASSSYSPDGIHVAGGSGDNGDLFVWNASNGELEKRLSGLHKSGSMGVAWGRGGSNGQQVASIDKSGMLVLWA